MIISPRVSGPFGELQIGKASLHLLIAGRGRGGVFPNICGKSVQGIRQDHRCVFGRPFEAGPIAGSWTSLGIATTSEKLGKPLVVTDDDITGTFTFVRAFEDYGFDLGLTLQQIGNMAQLSD